MSPNEVCHVPRSRMCCTSLSRRCHMSPEGMCQAPMPNPWGTGGGGCRPLWGAAPQVLLRSQLGTPSTGGHEVPLQQSHLRCWGSHQGGGNPPPAKTLSVEEADRAAPAPHCTPLFPTAPQPGQVPQGWGSPAQGVGCPAMTPRGAAVQGVPYTPPVPPAAPGSAGVPCLGRQPWEPSSPRSPHSEPPHQPVLGEPPRRGQPGGAGEGARR